MKSLAALLLLSVAPSGLDDIAVDKEATSHAPMRLARGTAIPLILRQPLSTKTNVKGDLFEMVVADDVRVGDHIVIPAGSRAVGEITRCETKGAFGRSGKIAARALYVIVGDRKIRTSGGLSARGTGAPTETVLTAAAIGVLSFVVTGKSAEIAEGTALQAALDLDAEI